MPEVTYACPWGPEKLPNMQILNLKSIAESLDMHPAIRGMAYSLMQNTYINIGFIFGSLPDKDIVHFKHLFIQAAEEYQFISDNNLPLDLRKMPATSQVTTLCFLLARAEGDCETTAEVLHNAIQTVSTLFFIEELARQKKIKINRKAYSLGWHKYPVVLDKTLQQLRQMKEEGDSL